VSGGVVRVARLRLSGARHGHVVTAVDAVPEAGGLEGWLRTVEKIRSEVRVRQQRRMRVRVSWPADLMADLWRLPEAQPYLAEGTVKAVYQFLQDVGLSQREIARMTGQQQSEISEIMTGRQVHSVPVLARIASGLRLPPGVFGLAPRPPGPAASADEAVPATSDDAADVRADEVLEEASPMTESIGGRVSHCPTCRCGATAGALVAPHHGEPVGPLHWTGAELRGLRLCVHLSVRQFAAAMGVSDRAVSNWEAGGADWTPRAHSQAAADRVLSRALPLQRARFAAWLTSQLPGPVAQHRPDGTGRSVGG
jgi:transcriptional regulator with XRE-family HTH domain